MAARAGRAHRCGTAAPYAPELNSVEAIRDCLKEHEIANLCLHTIGEVGRFARNRLKSMPR